MEIECFPGCCGIEVVSGFTDAYIDLPVTPKKRREVLRGYIRDYDIALMATLVPSQRLKWDKHLQAEGFRVLRKFKNPNSGNTVYLYYRGPKRLRKR